MSYNDLMTYDDREMISDIVESGACDLHLHTHYSDGADSVVSLVQKVMASKLKCFAVADHDCIDAIPETLRLLKRLRELGFVCPEFIPGIEISAEFGDAGHSKEIHILGYFPHGRYEEMAGFVNEQRRKRNERNVEMCKCLTALGMPVTIEELNSQGQKSIGRLHAANILMRKGYISSVKEGFDTLFGYGRPCYVMRDKPDAALAVSTIRNAGGSAVIAHPYLYKWTGPGDGIVSETLALALKSLKEAGICGAEAFHGEASPEQREETYAAALSAGLIPTAGSDYHGDNKDGVRMFGSGSVFIEKDAVFEAAVIIECDGKYLVMESDELTCSGKKTFMPCTAVPLRGSTDPDARIRKYIKERFADNLEVTEHYITAYGRQEGQRHILTAYKTIVKSDAEELLRCAGEGRAGFKGLQDLMTCDMPDAHTAVIRSIREIPLCTDFHHLNTSGV